MFWMLLRIDFEAWLKMKKRGLENSIYLIFQPAKYVLCEHTENSIADF